MIRCIQCGEADLETKTIQLSGTVRGEDYTVEIQGVECPRCGYKTIEGEAMPEFGRLLADKYRAQHGLLTSEEIRARRSRLGMTQEKFAQHLGVGLASVKRWEMGKIQDQRSNDCIIEKTRTLANNVAVLAGNFGQIYGSTSQHLPAETYSCSFTGRMSYVGVGSVKDMLGVQNEFAIAHGTSSTFDLEPISQDRTVLPSAWLAERMTPTNA